MLRTKNAGNKRVPITATADDEISAIRNHERAAAKALKKTHSLVSHNE